MNTTPQQAGRYVTISAMGLLVIATYRGKLTGGDIPLAKRLWGTGVLAIMLGLVADVAPQIAGPFAVLILVGSLTNGGDKALHNFLGKATGASLGPDHPAGPQGPSKPARPQRGPDHPKGPQGPSSTGGQKP